MKLLLDTHTFIWWDSDPSQLSTRVITAMQDPSNEIYLSVVSAWEMQIKIQLGKLSLTRPLEEIITGQQTVNGILILPVELEHVFVLDSLEFHHKDPFDRLLMSQSIVENATLLSKDKIFKRYPVDLLW